MKLSHPFKLLIAILVAECAGIIGSFFTAFSVPSWYEQLARPSTTPPSWVFGPVWTILYAMMGIAAYLVWKKTTHKKQVRHALSIFILQLVLNVIWIVIFFGAHSITSGLIEILALVFAVVATIIAFEKVSKPAAFLLLPYLIWVTFAMYLNYSIWLLNTNYSLIPTSTITINNGTDVQAATLPYSNWDFSVKPVKPD